MFIFSTKYKEQRVLQPNFLHGNAIFGHMGSFKGAAQKQVISTQLTFSGGMQSSKAVFVIRTEHKRQNKYSQ